MSVTDCYFPQRFKDGVFAFDCRSNLPVSRHNMPCPAGAASGRASACGWRLRARFTRILFIAGFRRIVGPGHFRGWHAVRPDCAGTKRGSLQTKPGSNVPVDANGNPIPLERQQPRRILGFMPNFRSVSGGATPPAPGWKYNFTVATHQATDYSTFIILGLTSLLAEGENEHPVFGKGMEGYYSYTWRGFLDKSDGTYLSAWLLPSILHEDTRFYALGTGHGVAIRELYVISRQGVARTYGGRQTPNFAGLGGKVLTQVVSRYYYPPSATTFSVLATKFGYSAMRDVINSTIREFYPDIAAHYIRRHQAKMARKAAQDAGSTP